MSSKPTIKECHPCSCCCDCCFSKDTIVTINEDGIIIKKFIQDVKKDDLILTLFNQKKIFTKVLFKKNYDEGIHKFYEFKCYRGKNMKKITVTHNHIMMAYDKDKKQLKFKNAESVIKNEDYFDTTDGLYQVKEIKELNMEFKYALGVQEGSILADDVLVSCFNFSAFNKEKLRKEIMDKFYCKGLEQIIN